MAGRFWEGNFPGETALPRRQHFSSRTRFMNVAYDVGGVWIQQDSLQHSGPAVTTAHRKRELAQAVGSMLVRVHPRKEDAVGQPIFIDVLFGLAAA